jgi:carbonic anhydrase/acetyltransferase-like protein (isoleucine patch superfamily)
MNAVLMDRVVIGAECVIGSLSFVAADTVIPDRSVVVGSPAKVVKQVSDQMLEWKKEGTRLYQKLPSDCFATLRACEPLREVPADRHVQDSSYKTWRETQK